jgi:hypothetical protein
MPKNFLVVKGMTLMGEGGLKFKRFASKYHDASRTFLGGMGQSFWEHHPDHDADRGCGPETQVQ